MLNTDKYAALELARLLALHDVRHVVTSPGTRDAPLVMALCRAGAFDMRVVIDERSAAFVALGIALVSGEATVLVCTSGTAVLNYAPAVAEAYYRHVPLIVVSADRPAQWIDQDDSQTIRQYRVLDSVVKASYNIVAELNTADLQWLANRTINDAIAKALMEPRGPVHLNVAFDEPIGSEKEMPGELTARKIEVVTPTQSLTTAQFRALAAELLAYDRVLVIVGHRPPDASVTKALNKLASLHNVAIMTEAQSNAHCRNAVSCIDATLSAMSHQQRCLLTPQVVITLGGSLLSRMVKAFLRDSGVKEHWHIGLTDDAVDNFKCLTRRIEIDPLLFLPMWSSAMQICHRSVSSYSQSWREARRSALKAKNAYVATAPWSDLKAMSIIMTSLPKTANLQLSNGTSVRYAQLFANDDVHRVDCNRGVSGIDGCTSTAIGAATQYGGLTVLVTGDMSAQYDIGALACTFIPATFRMIVLNNGGGGIFRFIKNTSSLAETPRFMACDVRLPLRELCRGYGLKYLEARDEASLHEALRRLFNPSVTEPAVLNVVTPPELSAQVLRDYFAVKADIS